MKFDNLFSMMPPVPPHTPPHAHPHMPPHAPAHPTLIELEEADMNALRQMIGEEAAETAAQLMMRVPPEAQLLFALQLRLFMQLNDEKEAA